MNISKNLCEKIIKKYSICRSSKSGIEFLQEFIENEVKNISKKSCEIAKHSNRKVMKKSDVLICLEECFKN